MLNVRFLQITSLTMLLSRPALELQGALGNLRSRHDSSSQRAWRRSGLALLGGRRRQWVRIASWLSGRVGATGSVLVTDIDTRFLNL